MPRKQPPPGYMSASQAAKALGVTRAMLGIYVRQNKLHRYGPDTRQQKFYMASEVQALVDADKAFFGVGEEMKESTVENHTFVFAQATPEDAEGIYEIARRNFGHTSSADLRRPLIARCPEGNYVVKDNGVVVAYIHIQPLKHDRLMAFMHGDIRGWDITADDLDCFEPEKTVEVLIKSIGSDPDVDREIRLNYVRRLLRGTSEELEKLGSQGVIISKVFATSDTPTGIAMSLRAHMTQLGMLGKRLTFMLDVETSNIPLLQAYKRRLAEWRKQRGIIASDPEPLIDVGEPASQPEGLLFRRATLDDLEAEYGLAYKVFGDPANNVKAPRKEYLETGRVMYYHLYDNRELVALINIVPLSDEALQQFRAGKRGWTYLLSEIQQLEPDRAAKCIIIDMIATPDVPEEKREWYAGHLLAGVSRELLELGKHGIEITHVCAASGTELGKRILKTAGFRPIYDAGAGRWIYELDVMASTLKILKGYKQAFTEWKTEHRSTTDC